MYKVRIIRKLICTIAVFALLACLAPLTTAHAESDPAVDISATAAVLDVSHYQVAKPSSFSAFDDYVKAWSYMLVNTDVSESFSLGKSCSRQELMQVMKDVQNAFSFAVLDYMEYYSFLNKCRISARYSIDETGNCTDPTITLRISNSFGISDAEIARQISVFNDTCAQIVTDLYNEGSLTTAMPVKEKAYVLYRYMAYQTKYDTSYTLYNGYDAAVNGSAVCLGYTAMYNYLCNLAGVPMEAMTGKVGDKSHAWSRIYSDGSWYNIDSTWSDSIPDEENYCDETWFWVTDSYLKTCSNPRTFDIDTLVYG